MFLFTAMVLKVWFFTTLVTLHATLNDEYLFFVIGEWKFSCFEFKRWLVNCSTSFSPLPGISKIWSAISPASGWQSQNLIFSDFKICHGICLYVSPNQPLFSTHVSSSPDRTYLNTTLKLQLFGIMVNGLFNSRSKRIAVLSLDRHFLVLK